MKKKSNKLGKQAKQIHSIRIQRVIANSGIMSRRAAEKLIENEQILLNEKLAILGTTAQENDTIHINKKEYLVKLDTNIDCRTLIYNKPIGEITSRNDPEGRPTIFDKLPDLKQGRWISIGRLDINTSGLLLLTNDGELAQALMHPSNRVDREYACRIRGIVSSNALKQLRRGVQLDDGIAKFTDISVAGGRGQNRWYHVVIMEGRNREVRRLWRSQGVDVSRLKRVRFGPVFLPHELKQGHYKELSADDIKVLRKEVKLPEPKPRLILEENSPKKNRPKLSLRKKSS